MKSLIFSIVVVFFLTLSSQVIAEEFTCWFSAPAQNDIWVIVYQADKDGDRGDVIWEGKIAAGERKQIKCDSGQIRYDYARKKGQPYEGDLARMCDEDVDIQL